MYRDSYLRLLPALLVVALLVLPAGAACPVSWRDKTLTYTRACTIIDMADNVTLKDVFIQENRSANLADMITLLNGNISMVLFATDLNFTHWVNEIYIGEAKNRSEDKAAIILEMENQQAANDTHTANEIYIGTERNISLSVDGAASNLSHEVDAGAVNLSEGKAAAIAEASHLDTLNVSATHENETALEGRVDRRMETNITTVIVHDANGTEEHTNYYVEYGFSFNDTQIMKELYVRLKLSDAPATCELSDDNNLTWKIWDPLGTAPTILGNTMACDMPFGVNDTAWIGLRFNYPITVTPDDIVGYTRGSALPNVIFRTRPLGEYYDDNLPWAGNFEAGITSLYAYGIDVTNRLEVETVWPVPAAEAEGDKVLADELLNRTHDFNENQIAANLNITAAMPLAGNTSVPATSIADDVMTFLDATGHAFADSGYTIEQVINQALTRNTNTTGGSVTLGAVGQQQNPLIEQNRTGAENTAAHMVAANLTLGGNVSVPDVSTPNGIVIFADALGHTFSDSGRLISEFLTTFAPAIKEMEDQLSANLTHEHNEGILAHVFNDTHWFNLGILSHVSNDTHWFNEGILAHVLNDTSLENRIYFSVWANGTLFGNWSFQAPMMKEIGNQYTANDTTVQGAAIKWASDSDTANRSGAENTASRMAAANASAAIKWASDSDTLNDTATKAAAIKTADDHISTNITTTADIRLMAYQFVTPASGGAAYSAPVEGSSGNIWVPIDFDGTSSEAAVADILLPSDYSAGFTEAYSWTATSAGGGGVVWGTELACISDNTGLGDPGEGGFYWGTQVLITDTFQTSGRLHISPISATTTPFGTCLPGRTMAIRVKRMPAEAGDTMSDDARFLGMNLTYTKAGA